MRQKQLSEIPVDGDLRELTVRGTPVFPIAIFDNDIDQYTAGEVPWHWHKEVEFCIAKKGVVLLLLSDRRITLKEGEGAFINSNTLHAFQRGAALSQFISYAFEIELIAGLPGGVVEQKYIRPFIDNKCLDVLELRPGTDWQGQALKLLLEAYDAFMAEELGYEIKVRDCLSQVWYRFVRNVPYRQADAGPSVQDGRIKRMLSYIHENYQQQVTLADVARAAGISVSECCRCFKQRLHATPFTYLTDYRIRVAARLLQETDLPITRIGLDVGFRSPSHFGKVFRQATGVSPRAYREQGNANAQNVPAERSGKA